MILRLPLALPLDFPRFRPPPHIRLAIAVSASLHVLAIGYVAFMKFNSPPVVELPQGPTLDGPLVKLPKPPPPDKPVHKAAEPPLIHVPPLINDPPLPPLSTDPPRQTTEPPLGPIATLDPPRVVPPTPPRDPVIHDPRWVSQPDADEFARFYPERALRMSKEGEATLRCEVAANGQLRNCQVSGETPENFGFGQAAIKLARYMRIAPKTVDGQPVDGGILVEPIKFRLK